MKTVEPENAAELAHLLKYDTWTPNQAFCLFCELSPTLFDDATNPDLVMPEAIRSSPAFEKFFQLWDIWMSGIPIREEAYAYSPAYYVNWAKAKKIEIPWLAWAEGSGYMVPAEKASIAPANERDIKMDATKITTVQAVVDQAPAVAGRAHVSDKLAKLIQASARFWANADREDRSTHELNATVVAWLVDRGYSQTLAESAATIIRPEWAPTGRRPEE